jgi:hypothetical protein
MATLKESGGFEDLMVMIMFDGHCLSQEMVEEQMSYFAENIMPVLRKEYGVPSRQDPPLNPPVAPGTTSP